MLHIDLPATQDIAELSRERADACVSIYLPTTPVTQNIRAARIEYGNLVKQALAQLDEVGFDKRRRALLEENLTTFAEDDAFWALQAHSLAVLATPDRLRTYRLANNLSQALDVSDRFYLKPLLRALAFPHEAYVLALSENGVRLIEVLPGGVAQPVKVPGLPKDAASHSGKSSLNDRSHSGRIHGDEGQRIRHLQYLHAIDGALRPLLVGHSAPLIVAGVNPLAVLFHSVNRYHHLVSQIISVNPDETTDQELAARTAPLLDEVYAEELAKLKAVYGNRSGVGRTSADLSDVARAAVRGAVELLMVDIDQNVQGWMDEDGGIRFAAADTAKSYDIVDEIAAHVLATGGRVLAVRKDDLPVPGAALCAILRYAG
ncbi:hypothetical protein [Aestuariivirga sp.]|uniref:baeRF11 domain-containing protein n=1 Tax=Aestuariivirga sp. TaxID=2650926 RepID=UPI0025BCC1B8|nr:hypothetical protein [Aestuariivirga sp.]MCA3554429.1 hypothetical protein [Aestuariivirga sp.]